MDDKIQSLHVKGGRHHGRRDPYRPGFQYDDVYGHVHVRLSSFDVCLRPGLKASLPYMGQRTLLLFFYSERKDGSP